MTSPIKIVDDAVEDWWAVNRAVYNPSTYCVYVGGIAADGKAVIASYNRSTKERTRTVLAQLGVDEHNSPGILVENDYPPIVAYTNHNADYLIRVRRGTAIHDIANFNAEQTIAASSYVTYIQLHRESGTPNLLLLTRVGGNTWHFTRSDDFGATWSTTAPIFSFGQMAYIVTSKDDADVLHVALYGHPTSSTIHDVYFCTVDLVSGDIKKKDGTVVANFKTGADLPVDVLTTLDQIYTHPEGHSTRLFDINMNDEVVIADWTNDDDARYKYLVRSADVWTVKDMVAAGDPIGYNYWNHYHAGASLAFDGRQGVVYLGREAAGVWYMEKWATLDGGDTWTTTEIDQSADVLLVRPWQPIGLASIIYVGFTYYYGFNSYTGDTYWYLDQEAPVAGPHLERKATGQVVRDDFSTDTSANYTGIGANPPTWTPGRLTHNPLSHPYITTHNQVSSVNCLTVYGELATYAASPALYALWPDPIENRDGYFLRHISDGRMDLYRYTDMVATRLVATKTVPVGNPQWSRVYKDGTVVVGRSGVSALTEIQYKEDEDIYPGPFIPALRGTMARWISLFDGRTSNRILCSGLNAGWYADATDGTSDATPVAAVAGAASVDCGVLLFGTAGFKFRIFDGDPAAGGALVAEYTNEQALFDGLVDALGNPASLGGGDVFEWSAGGVPRHMAYYARRRSA